MEIENIFRYISPTSDHTAKRTMPSDSAHQIGPSTLWMDVLTVDQGVCRWRFKNCEIWYVFNYGARIRGGIVKRMVRLDSAHQIGVVTLSRKVLTVHEGVCK